jgi:hypothetical protein
MFYNRVEMDLCNTKREPGASPFEIQNPSYRISKKQKNLQKKWYTEFFLCDIISGQVVW